LSVVVLTTEASNHSIEFQIRKRRLCTSIRNLGDDGEVKLTIKGRKISARVEHWGGLQSFSATLNTDGTWNGKLIRPLKKERIKLLVRGGKTSRRKMNQLSRFLPYDSGILLGSARTKASNEPKGLDSQFRIKLTVSPELEVRGLIKHKSGRHYTRIELTPGGRWNTQGWVKLTGGRFLFSAEAGKCRSRFEGTPRHVATGGNFSRR
jgi:hypothetical protein